MPLPPDLEVLLAHLVRLPTDRPFATHEAGGVGVDSHVLTALVDAELLKRPLRGVYVPPALPDTLEVRLQALRLVIPPDCVVTDRTAAWLWRAETVLPPGAHLAPPRISVFAPPGRRLRNDFVASGERELSDDDVVELGGVLVTTPLRTSCDLARLLPPAYALGTVDMVAKAAGLSAEQIVDELGRFKGYRGIVQARVVAERVDPRSGSVMEGASRWVWHGARLPWPECQVPIPAPRGSYFIDIGLPDEEFGLEYFGEEFHGEDDELHDEERLAWARGVVGWTLVVARKINVIGRAANLEAMLRRDWKAHREGRRTR